MPSLDEAIEPLKEAIRNAFAGIEHPGDDVLLSPDCFNGHDVEPFRKNQAPTNWEQLSADVIDYNYDSLPFFSPEAYRFILPAYLTRALDSYRGPSNVIEFVVYNLILPKDQLLREHFMLQKSNLNDCQRNVILRFLQAIKDGYESLSSEADEAIRSYWHLFA